MIPVLHAGTPNRVSLRGLERSHPLRGFHHKRCIFVLLAVIPRSVP